MTKNKHDGAETIHMMDVLRKKRDGEELTREELMRIWDTLPMKYCLTVPYVARGLRVVLQPDMRQYAPVLDRALVMGEST